MLWTQHRSLTNPNALYPPVWGLYGASFNPLEGPLQREAESLWEAFAQFAASLGASRGAQARAQELP